VNHEHYQVFKRWLPRLVENIRMLQEPILYKWYLQRWKRKGKQVINISSYDVWFTKKEHIHVAVNLPASKSKLFVTAWKCIQATFMLINSRTHSLIFTVSVESTKANQAKNVKFALFPTKATNIGLELNLSNCRWIGRVNCTARLPVTHSYQFSCSVLNDENNLYCIYEFQI